MKTLGIIAEYNPFHNGHMYHLNRAKELIGASHTVCVMSGNFIQRGEPAIINKWARSKMAILNGVDLVLELPMVYASASAEFFAYGAVKILESTGIVESICFGSESGSLEELDEISDILVREPIEYKLVLKQELDRGISFPLARDIAIKKYTNKSLLDLKKSNNILGIEYLKALKKLNSNIKPLTIKRINNTYNSTELSGNISSATSIRNHIYHNKNIKDLRQTMPKASFDILIQEIEEGRGPVFINDFQDMLYYCLRSKTLEQIKSTNYISEGLENRIKSVSLDSGDIHDLIEKISTKRYTKTRIQRCLISILIGLSKIKFEHFNINGGPQYIRVLGFNDKGKELLGKMKKNAKLPIATKVSKLKNASDMLIRDMLELEEVSTDIYVLAYKNAEFRVGRRECCENIIILD